MPEYTWYCGNCGWAFTEWFPGGEAPLICCAGCDSVAQREYQPTRVNWGGLRPSQGEHSRHFRDLFKHADENREKYKERKHEHEIRQAAAEKAEHERAAGGRG